MDGETKGQDALPKGGQPSGDRGGSPSTEPVKTYTETEVAERHGKLDRTIAQLTKERDTLKQESEATRQQLADIQRRIDETAEEEARGSPESLRLYQGQKELRTGREQLKEERRQFEEQRQLDADKLVRLAELEAKDMIVMKAVEHHVDIGQLEERVKKFNLSTEEQIAEMASILATTGKKVPPKGDSGLSVGGTDLNNMSASDLIKYGVRQSK